MQLSNTDNQHNIIDSHCHLDLLIKQSGRSIESIVDAASKNGVIMMQTISTLICDFNILLDIAEKHRQICCSVGTHPDHAHEEQIDTDRIIEITKHPKVTGIGECGLDYYRTDEHKLIQRKVFEAHIHASQETQIPLIIHTRSADADTADILEIESRNKPFPILMHCYTSGKELAYRAMDLGAYMSASGIVTFKNAIEIRELFSGVPNDRLIIETDSPYLAPVPNRGKINEPSYVMHVNDKLAEMKDISYGEMAKITTDNFMSLFKKAVQCYNA